MSEDVRITSDKQITQVFYPERVAKSFPVEQEPQIPTLSAPVIIESAYPGWQTGGARFPAVPRTIDEQVQEIIDSVKAGAAAIHVHPRNPKTGYAEANPHLLKEILDPVFEEVGNVVTLNHTWMPAEEADYITETAKLLELGGGNKYCQGSVVLAIGFTSGGTGAFHSIKSVCEGVRFLEQNKVKPVYQLYDTFTAFGFKLHVFDHGYAQDPKPLFNLHLGKHHAHAVHKDPWSHMQLITNYNLVNETFPNSITGVYPGGRNWVPILTMGLLLGTPLIRVGIEDCYWMYPHKDELIKKNSDTVKLAVDIATALGRRVVTDPDEARQILGIQFTS